MEIDFIKNNIELAIDKFVNDFKNLILKYERFDNDESEMAKSYTYLARSDRDLDDDLWIVSADIYDIGWTDVKLNTLFSNNYASEKISLLLIDDSRGTFDVFLYKWTNKMYPISGVEWDIDDSDIVIKYKYAWNKTKYGQIFLKQVGLSDSEFINKSTSKFVETCIYSTIYGFIREVHNASSLANDIVKKSVIFKDNKISFNFEKTSTLLSVIIFSFYEDVLEDSIKPTAVYKNIMVDVNYYGIDYTSKSGILYLTF